MVMQKKLELSEIKDGTSIQKSQWIEKFSFKADLKSNFLLWCGNTTINLYRTRVQFMVISYDVEKLEYCNLDECLNKILVYIANQDIFRGNQIIGCT